MRTTIGVIALTMCAVWGQGFEVASVKPTKIPSPPTLTLLPGGERLVARNMPLLWLIGAAYGVPNRQISGLPPAMATEGYDIEAKTERPVGRAQMMLMLRSLVEDRFKLTVQRETREIKAQVLVLTSGGGKLDENRDGLEMGMRKISGNKMSYHNMPMSMFANVLGGAVDDTVVDGTGMKGSCDFTLEYYAGPGGRGVQEGREPAPDANGPALASALREQLGLRLESRKGPVEVLVVNHIERVSGN
jgi:uncharacterized protein (TIGR03435 family)